MNNINIMARLGWLVLVLSLALMAGCKSEEEYEKVQAEREDYRNRLQIVHQANDQLNKEVTDIYAECEMLSTQLSMKMAMLVHSQYTTGLVRRVVPAPPTQPRTTSPPPRPPRSESGSGRNSASGDRPSRPSGSNNTVTTPPPAAPTSPPPQEYRPRPRGDMDVNWK